MQVCTDKQVNENFDVRSGDYWSPDATLDKGLRTISVQFTCVQKSLIHCTKIFVILLKSSELFIFP